MNNIEKFVSYKLGDKQEISGILNRITTNSKVVVFVHGLSGDVSEPAFHSAKQIFPLKGYDTLRLFLYSHDKKSKRFSWNTSISQHTEDLEDIVKNLERKYKQIFVVGHSIGGPVIYQSEFINNHKKIPAVSLWEPTISPVGVKKDFRLDKKLNRYFSYGLVVSEKFVNELHNLKSNSIANFTKPFQLILSTSGQLKKNWKDAEKNINSTYEKVLIKNTYHNFSKDNDVDELLSKTLKYFNKF